MSALQSLFRTLHPLIRMATHLSCCFWLLLWAACWCPSLCLDNFPEQRKLIISGIFNTAFPFSVGEHFTFFLAEFSSLSCFQIRKIYRTHFDFLKNSFPGMLISASANVSSADFTSKFLLGWQHIRPRQQGCSGAASLLVLFHTEAGSLC